MKNLIKLCVLSTIILLAISCTKYPIDIKGGNSNMKSVSVMEAPDGPDGEFLKISGASSKLSRSSKGIKVKFKTNGLIPGNAYTMWWIVFGETPGPPASLYASGQVVYDSGNNILSSHLNASPDFTNPLTAEVHIVLRTHGVAVPGIIDEQIGGRLGGCDVDLTFPEGPGMIWPDSDEVGYCANIQVAEHPPVE